MIHQDRDGSGTHPDRVSAARDVFVRSHGLAGALTATQRATQVWQKALELYEQPPLDPAISEALDTFVAKRKEELQSVDH